jgi:hypothetical protein
VKRARGQGGPGDGRCASQPFVAPESADPNRPTARYCTRTVNMYLLKIKHGETRRRILLDDVFTFSAL